MAEEIWQADLAKSKLSSDQGEVLWQLLLTDCLGKLIYQNYLPQSQLNSSALAQQLQLVGKGRFPQLIQIFRPSVAGLFQLAAKEVGVESYLTGRAYGLKRYLKQLDPDYLYLEQFPPEPLPESVWGKNWQFTSLGAADLELFYGDRPIPITGIDPLLTPFNLGLASNCPIPGVIIKAGRQSLNLARWIEETEPVSLNYISSAEGGGLVLNSGAQHRWIMMTFKDPEIAQRADLYQQRQAMSKGLHFLLVQPDDSGMTHTGFWLLLTI